MGQLILFFLRTVGIWRAIYQYCQGRGMITITSETNPAISATVTDSGAVITVDLSITVANDENEEIVLREATLYFRRHLCRLVTVPGLFAAFDSKREVPISEGQVKIRRHGTLRLDLTFGEIFAGKLPVKKFPVWSLGSTTAILRLKFGGRLPYISRVPVDVLKNMNLTSWPTGAK